MALRSNAEIPDSLLNGIKEELQATLKTAEFELRALILESAPDFDCWVGRRVEFDRNGNVVAVYGPNDTLPGSHIPDYQRLVYTITSEVVTYVRMFPDGDES